MPRPLRIDYPGALHHIFSRGNKKEDIFNDVIDREKFLRFLSKNQERYGCKIYAYCLMDNHFHLLVETGDAPISNFMQQLLTSYVQYFNKRWDRVGHLLQGRYKSVLVDKDAYLLTLVRYIHLNPVNALLVGNPKDYEWSSHLEYLGFRKPIVNLSFVESLFSDIQAYEKFILGGINHPQGYKAKRYKRYLFYGDEKFINNALAKVSQQKRAEGKSRKKVSEKDIKKFIESKLGKTIQKFERYQGTIVKQYFVVLMRDRMHLTLKNISKKIDITLQGVRYYYKMDNKEEILKEFDEFFNFYD